MREGNLDIKRMIADENSAEPPNGPKLDDSHTARKRARLTFDEWEKESIDAMNRMASDEEFRKLISKHIS